MTLNGVMTADACYHRGVAELLVTQPIAAVRRDLSPYFVDSCNGRARCTCRSDNNSRLTD